MQQDLCQLRSRGFAKLSVMPLLIHTLSLTKKRSKPQFKLRLWYTEITIAPKSKYYKAQHSKILQSTWRHFWKGLGQKEDGATRHCKCCSSPSTRRRRSTKSYWLEMHPQTLWAMFSTKERKVEAQTSGLQMGFQRPILISRSLILLLRTVQYTHSTWTTELDSNK